VAGSSETTGRKYDTFLSHNGADKQAVHDIAIRLREEAGINPFLDQWHLVPGEPWQEALEDALEDSSTCIVFLGDSGAGPWEREEMRSALELRVASPDFRVIPALLPSVESRQPDPRSLPPFLRRVTWVDLSSRDGFDRLVAGIKGFAPVQRESLMSAPRWLELVESSELKNPTGIAAFANGYFVSDHTKGHVVRFTEGQSEVIYSGLNRPHHIAIWGDLLLVADSHNNQIVCLDWTGKPTWSKRRFGTEILRRPHAIAVYSTREFYVLNSDRDAAFRVADGKMTARTDPVEPEGVPLATPCGMAHNPTEIMIADTYNHRICAFDFELNYLGSFGERGSGPGAFQYPVGLAAWHGWVFVADEHNQRLQLWKVRDRTLWRRGGQIADPVASSLLSPWLTSPFGVCISSSGRCFITDRVQGRVLSFDVVPFLARYE
jgi:hypothetical protein